MRVRISASASFWSSRSSTSFSCAASGSVASSSSSVRRVRPMLNSAWVTESCSSRARCARSWLAASSAAWLRRSPSSRSRSLMSRTAPCAPANLPSTTVPVMATSVWAMRPSGSGRSSRTRCSRVGLLAKRLPGGGGRGQALAGERREGLPEQLLGLPAGARLERVAEEGEVALGVDAPHDVRRVVDEVPVAALRLLDLGVQARVGEGDGGLVGQELEQLGILGAEGVALDCLDGDRADEPVGPEQRRRHHRVDLLRLDPRVALVVRETPRRRGSRRSSARAARPPPCPRCPEPIGTTTSSGDGGDRRGGDRPIELRRPPRRAG